MSTEQDLEEVAQGVGALMAGVARSNSIVLEVLHQLGVIDIDRVQTALLAALGAVEEDDPSTQMMLRSIIALLQTRENSDGSKPKVVQAIELAVKNADR